MFASCYHASCSHASCFMFPCVMLHVLMFHVLMRHASCSHALCFMFPCFMLHVFMLHVPMLHASCSHASCCAMVYVFTIAQSDTNTGVGHISCSILMACYTENVDTHFIMGVVSLEIGVIPAGPPSLLADVHCGKKASDCCRPRDC